MLSQPKYSAIISWEGISGQFKIINPNLVVSLWGERNGRRNMSYQKFSRALRYYYQKKVLAKIRGQRYVYKFNLQELKLQYGQQRISFPATSESTSNGRQETTSFPGSLSPRPPEREKRDLGTGWSRAFRTIENIREGSSNIKYFVALYFVDFKAR